MGKGKEWKPEESMHLAMAWVDASEEVGEPSLRGTSQHFNEFWSKVRANYLKHQPAPCPPGKYSHRATTALQTQWRDNIAREARRFNRNLLLVLNSRPTGCTEQQKINMAVAIQLGKTDVRSYRHRDFEARYSSMLMSNLPPIIAPTMELLSNTLRSFKEPASPKLMYQKYFL